MMRFRRSGVKRKEKRPLRVVIDTGDKHLKDVEVFHGAKITNAKGFVERVRKG